MKFKELGLDDKILEAISYMGFDHATPIQETVIPTILRNQDLIACSQTGSGKTAAFVLPILNKLIGKQELNVDTLIIVPTRELAIQIEQQLEGFSYFVSAKSVAVYGGGDGGDWDYQKKALKNGTDIIVATPGKFLSHLKLGNMDLSKIKHLVLDEADRMLDMGFIDDIKHIISHLPKDHQTLMFSATMPGGIRKLAREILNNPVEVSLSVSKPVEKVDQKAYLLTENQKISLIEQVLSERKHYDSIIIFTSTKKKINDIVRALNRIGLPSQGISSDLDQNRREEVLRDFRSKRIRIMVATDVMSRGIDVKEINLVINFDIPQDPEDYVHRIGRTARINAEGEAITLYTHSEAYKLKKIEQLIGGKIPLIQLPENTKSASISKERPAEKKFKRKFKK